MNKKIAFGMADPFEEGWAYGRAGHNWTRKEAEGNGIAFSNESDCEKFFQGMTDGQNNDTYRLNLIRLKIDRQRAIYQAIKATWGSEPFTVSTLQLTSAVYEALTGEGLWKDDDKSTSTWGRYENSLCLL